MSKDEDIKKIIDDFGLDESFDVFDKDKNGKISNEKTKTALKDFQNARKEYESAKTKRYDEVKKDINSTQNEIKAIDDKINVLKAEKVEKENEISKGEYNEERGKALAEAALSLYGGVSTGGDLCATGVSQVINKAFGYATYGNGCDYADVLSNRDDWVEITDQYPSADDLTSLPAGAVVSWSPYNVPNLGALYGHDIADGNGNEVSDFTAPISTYYADNGSTYRIFVPT